MSDYILQPPFPINDLEILFDDWASREHLPTLQYSNGYLYNYLLSKIKYFAVSLCPNCLYVVFFSYDEKVNLGLILPKNELYKIVFNYEKYCRRKLHLLLTQVFFFFFVDEERLPNTSEKVNKTYGSLFCSEILKLKNVRLHGS